MSEMKRGCHIHLPHRTALRRKGRDHFPQPSGVFCSAPPSFRIPLGGTAWGHRMRLGEDGDPNFELRNMENTFFNFTLYLLPRIFTWRERPLAAGPTKGPAPRRSPESPPSFEGGGAAEARFLFILERHLKISQACGSSFCASYKCCLSS